MKRDTSASRASRSPSLCQRANSSRSSITPGTTVDLGVADATVAMSNLLRRPRLQPLADLTSARPYLSRLSSSAISAHMAQPSSRFTCITFPLLLCDRQALAEPGQLEQSLRLLAGDHAQQAAGFLA